MAIGGGGLIITASAAVTVRVARGFDRNFG